MLKPILRILLSLLLCLFLAGFAAADETVHQAYIAVDSAANSSMLPLAGLLAHQAEQSGLSVQIIDLFAPEKDAIYSTGCGYSIADQLKSYVGKKLTDDKKMAHMCDFLEVFFKETFSATAPVDVYILSGYERELMVSGKWDESKGAFNLKALKNAHSAVSDAMESNPQLALHFFYGQSEENTLSKLDEKLLEQYPDRVSINLLQGNADDPDNITHALFSTMPSFAQNIIEGISDDGQIAYRSNGQYTLLCLEFDASDAPFSAVFKAEGQENSPIPAFIDTMGRCWIILPQGTSDGWIVLVNEAGEAYPASYRLTATSAFMPGMLSLSNASGQTFTAQQSFTLFNEEERLTLTIDQPGFDSSALIPSLTYTLTGSDVVNELMLMPDESLANTWHAPFPVLDIHASGELCAQYTLWDQTLPEQVYPFVIVNRAPKLADGVEPTLSLTAYYDVPGFDSSSMPYDLTPLFTDLDVNDQLTISVEPINSTEHSLQCIDGNLSYTAVGATSPSALTAKATDLSGECIDLTLNIKHLSVRDLTDALHMELPPEKEIPINVSTQYDLTLSSEAIAAVDDAFAALSHPSLKESLRIYVNDELKELTVAEDGSFTLSIPVQASSIAGEATFTLRAELALPNVEPYVLEHFFDAPEFTVRFINNCPRIAEGVVSDQQKESDISGLPGSYNAVPFEELFGSLRLKDLFVNDENEMLIYKLTAPKDTVSVNGYGDLEYGQKEITYFFSSESAAQPLDIEFLSPGEIIIELNVVDSSNQSLEKSVRYHVTLHSVFTRIVIIIVIALILLTGAVVAALLILKHMRPSFEGATADISNMRKQSEEKWFSPQMFTSVPLSCYEKNPVTLMMLLTASGQLPPRGCDANILTHIVFVPEKDGRFRVIRRGAAAQNETRLCINRMAADEDPVIFSGNQEISIRFAETSFNETLFIRIYRK